MAITVITLQENSINEKLTIQDGGKNETYPFHTLCFCFSNILHGLI